ncbi:transmembrane protein 161B-like isoform X2 [Gordionus sp. m RMFG-2023]|uniref:transmembrane protein 161B-like isoform X2 n=1 Tax=Gordionus sp. m RMFG-2023 TaxID=3053472 RepID=UPI0031FCE831
MAARLLLSSPLQTSSIHPPLLDLTLVWNICTLGFALSALIRPLITYPRHEKTLLIIAGIISALLCLAISFYIDFKHNYFITGISDTGNSTVNAAAGESGEKINKEFVSYEGWDQYRTTERAWLKNFKEIRFKLFYHFVLSLCSAILGSMIFFPCLRWAQMFIDAYGYSNRLDQKFFLFLNAIGPGISTLFWFFKPLLLTFTYNRYDDTTPLLNQDLASKFVKLNIIWLYSHIIFGVLRVALLRPHIQAYLYMAYEKVQAINKKENTSALAFNKSVKNAVNRINFYLGIVCIQYIVPVIISSSLTYILLSPTDASIYLKTDNENGSVNLIGDQTNLHDQLNSSHFIDLITRWTHQNASALSPPFKLLIFDPSILKAPVTQILFMFDVLMCVFGIFGYCYHKYN